jgi:alanine dehydrogenase
MTLILAEKDVRDALDRSEIAARIEAGLRVQADGQTEIPERLNLTTSTGGFLRLMAGVISGCDYMGCKVFNGSSHDGVRYLIVLYRETSGELLALVDAAYLTAARTGATTAIATKYCARPDAATVGVIGAGLEARTNLAAVSAVRSLTRVRVFSPTPSRRAAFALDMQAELGVSVDAVDAPELACRGADIVVVATNTSNRADAIAFRAVWAEPGMHVNSIGSTMPSLREIDENVLFEADTTVMDAPLQASRESGDVLAAVDVGFSIDSAVDLADVVAGTVLGRRSAEDLTLFKSIGTPLQDVLGAAAVYERALALGVGRQVEFLRLKEF